MSVYTADKSQDWAQFQGEGGKVSNLESLHCISIHFCLNIPFNKQLWHTYYAMHPKMSYDFEVPKDFDPEIQILIPAARFILHVLKGLNMNFHWHRDIATWFY